MKTQDIAARQRRAGLHPLDAGGGGMVSSKSGWTDDVWDLDVAANRRPMEGRLRWDEGIGPEITDSLKTLAWSLFVSRPTGAPLATTSAGTLSYALRYLGRWMKARRHRSFGTITPTAIQVFCDDLVKYLGQEEDGEAREIDIETEAVAVYLRPFLYADEQARHLEARGLPVIPRAPFGTSSVMERAAGIVPAIEGFTPPLPDEVVLPIVREAHEWLGVKGEDVLRLQKVVLDELRDDRVPITNWQAAMKRLAKFTFSPPHVDGEPWHPPFAEFVGARLNRAKPDEADGDESNAMELFGTDRVRRLTSYVIAACAIVIRFHTGIRHGELFTFAPGLRRDGTPVCVQREQSGSGAYEMFFVKGLLSKGEDEPVETRWLLAGRLYDDPELPAPVKALILLNRLTSPWRARSTDPEAKRALLIQPGHRGLAQNASLISPMSTLILSRMMKDFIGDRVDLSGLDPENERLSEYRESGGRCVQSRQWRKTWANWMIRVDKRLLPAISQQFHHRSVLLTEEAYVGKDAMQLGIVESAAMSRAVRYMRRAMSGETEVGGGMRKVVSAELEELKSGIAGLTGSAQDHEIRSWLLDRDIRIWFSPHGKCFVGLMPSDARCHEAAGTTDWSNQTPSFTHRTPQLCSGCPCFAVDEDDLPFWTERYVENRGIWDEAVGRNMEVNYSRAEERWRQSAGVLQSLGVDTAKLWENACGTHH